MAKESENNQNTDTGMGTDSKLAAIKEIIFGQEQAELKDDLESLKALVLEQNTALKKELEEVNSKLAKSIETLESEVHAKLEKQQKHTEKEISRIDKEKTNRKALGKMLVNIGEKLLKDS